MVLMGAVPILRGPQLIGVIYGGILVNRGTAVVDRIVDTIFKNEMYRESPIGTATVFLHDVRVATTVRLGNGNRAIGTRASKEVADRVLDNGTPWVGPAFVVQESYLTAYDPIRDVEGRVIGMLYVGRLERPFRDLQRTIMLRYLGLSVLGLGATMLLAIFLAGRLARPIHALAEAAHCMHRGDQHKPVAEHSSCDEIENLIAEFNEMAGALEERQTRLAEANRELAAKSAALSNLNRSYMDMLGFVSHELKSPVASMLNYSFLLKGGTLGPLTPRQQKAIQSIEAGTHRLSEMVRHYLNLSRIENDEMKPQPTRVAVLDDIVRPVLDTYAADIDGRQMRVENSIGAEVAVQADSSMVSEIFENLVSNAIKYGRDGGRVALTCREAGERYEFSVGNEGKGISAEHKDQLFEKFSRLNGGSQRVKGTGLGLFITKRIVEAHGGRIEVQSTPGQWTEFRFSLPKAPA
jgi:two-component system NtrC family sensor kinase